MFKKTLILIAVLASFLVAKPVFAEDEQICTQVYGGGVVCGASHEVVDTAISVHPAVLGTGLLGLSRVFKIISKKLKKSSDLE
ncbi:hypothetical protein ACFL15_01695 [Patescibacteria group bacterium]